jgi:hypothetical protein
MQSQFSEVSSADPALRRVERHRKAASPNCGSSCLPFMTYKDPNLDAIKLDLFQAAKDGRSYTGTSMGAIAAGPDPSDNAEKYACSAKLRAKAHKRF